MPADSRTPMVREVNLTTARNLSPLFDEAVRKEHPVLIVRGGKERGILLSREALLRMLVPYRFQVDIIPEDDQGFTLWLKELNLGAFGSTLKDARSDLLRMVHAYVRDYLDQFDFYRHLPDLAALEPYVLRLSLAKNEEELIEMLFGPRATGEAAA